MNNYCAEQIADCVCQSASPTHTAWPTHTKPERATTFRSLMIWPSPDTPFEYQYPTGQLNKYPAGAHDLLYDDPVYR